MVATQDLKSVVQKLVRLYPPGKSLEDPLELVLWENVGYLIDDDKRAALFAEFKTRIGVDPLKIARASKALLLDISRRGGMNAAVRVGRWQSIARIALEEGGGNLAATLRELPLKKARALLKKFPAIGDPGADRILLFGGISPEPCVESNGLRVLVRLGFCRQEKSYAATYKNAVGALQEAGAGKFDWLTSAYGSLREHGKTLCRRSKPQCLACPLDKLCAHLPATGL